MSVIYISVFLLSILLMEIYCQISRIHNKFINFIFYLSIIFPIAAVGGLRLGVGTDFYSYEYVFLKSVILFQSGDFFTAFSNSEPLYVLIEYLSYLVSGSNYHTFLFIVSAITMFPVIKFILEVVPLKQKSIALFIYLSIFYLTSFNIMRQMLAVSIVLFAYKYIINKNLTKYTLCIIIATLFHNSAIVAILFYYLNMDITIKKRLSLKQLLSLLAIFITPIIFVAIIKIGPNLPLVGVYFLNYSVVKNESNIFFLVLTILPILPALFNKKIITTESNGHILYNILLFSLFIGGIGLVSDWAFRLMYYTTSLIIFIYPLIIVKSRGIKKILFVLFIVIYTLIASYLTFVTFGFNNVLPYESISWDLLFKKY